MFQVGDKVVFQREGYPTTRGTFVKIETMTNGDKRVLMRPNEGEFNFGPSEWSGGVYRFDIGDIFPLYEMGPPVPKHIEQQRAVTQKCQKLWSRSKWGKKHPAFSC